MKLTDEEKKYLNSPAFPPSLVVYNGDVLDNGINTGLSKIEYACIKIVSGKPNSFIAEQVIREAETLLLAIKNRYNQ